MAKHVYPKPSAVKSIQHGLVTMGASATVDVNINAVNMDTTFIVKIGGHTTSIKNYLYLYDTDTVRCVNLNTATSYTQFYLVEFYDSYSIPIGGFQSFPLKAEISGIKSVQQVYFYMGNYVDYLDVEINSVDLNKVLLLPCANNDQQLAYTMIDSTHVRASRSYSGPSIARGQCCVVEFY